MSIKEIMENTDDNTVKEKEVEFAVPDEVAYVVTMPDGSKQYQLTRPDGEEDKDFTVAVSVDEAYAIVQRHNKRNGFID